MKGHLEETEIALLAGGEMNAGGKPGCARHLSECPACAARLENYRNDRLAMAGMGDAGIAAGDFDLLRHTVLDRLRRAESRQVRLALPQWRALAAIVLMALAIGIWWKQSTPRTQDSQLSDSVSPARKDPMVARPTPNSDAAANLAAGRAEANRLPQDSRTHEQRPTPDRSLPEVHVASGLSAPAFPPAARDDVVMKLETSDPNIIIIWLASPKGAER